MTKPIAIIGSGCAAMECIKSIRSSGCRDEIHLFADTSWPSYNPMLVTYYASGKIDFDELFPYGANHDFYHSHDVKAHLGSPVVKLDAINKRVYNAAGIELEYSRCLVATGATPLIPPIDGIQSEGVYTVRTVEDAIALKKTLNCGLKSVLVVGASMVGIKMVEMYLKHDINVYFADMAPHIFPLAAHENCSIKIENFLKKKGVNLRFNAALNRIVESNTGYEAYYKGVAVPDPVDIIIMCIGVRPNTKFIEAQQVNMKSGILVNEHMQTNCEGLYAAGDVAQGNNILTGEDQVIGLWANGRYQGRTAGLNMVGRKDRYPGTLPHNITHFMDIDFIGVGDVHGGDEVFEKTSEDKYIRLVWKKGRLVGINLLNTPEISGILKSILTKGLIDSANNPLDTFSDSTIANIKLFREFPQLKSYLMERR